ncbi:MAG: hypothetical protein SGCHY_003877 [Lobulomycetales sp.]
MELPAVNPQSVPQPLPPQSTESKNSFSDGALNAFIPPAAAINPAIQLGGSAQAAPIHNGLTVGGDQMNELVGFDTSEGGSSKGTSGLGDSIIPSTGGSGSSHLAITVILPTIVAAVLGVMAVVIYRRSRRSPKPEAEVMRHKTISLDGEISMPNLDFALMGLNDEETVDPVPQKM